MQYVDIAKRHFLLVAAAFGALLGIMIGLFMPIQAAPPMQGEALEWSLPSPQSVRRFDMAQYESLKTAGFWDTRAAARGASVTSAWTLRAIMTRPIAQVAVGMAGKNEQKWVRLGGTLPDGAILAAIDRDAVWFVADGCRRMKRLYSNTGGGSTPSEDGKETCAGDASDAPAGSRARTAANARPDSSGVPPSNGK